MSGGEETSRPGPGVSTSKTILTRIPIEVTNIGTLCTRTTERANELDRDSTEMEVKQLTDLQDQVFSLQFLIMADISEILGRRKKIDEGLMQQARDDTEITEFVERSMDEPDGRVKGRVGHMIKVVKDAIKKRREEIQAAQLEHERQLSGVRTAATGTGGGSLGTHRDNTRAFKPSTEFKPKTVLKYSCDLSEIEYYTSSFETYFSMSENSDRMSLIQQQALFKTLVDAELNAKVEERIDKTTATFQTCVDLVTTIFQEKFPLIHRRCKALRISQEAQESHLDFLTRFKKSVQEAEFGKLTVEQLLSLCCINNTRNTKFKEKLLMVKFEQLSLDKITQVSRELSQIISSLGEAEATFSAQTSTVKLGLCNSCNGKNHYAAECRTKSKLTCSDCKQKYHRNKNSGFCKLNPTGRTINPDFPQRGGGRGRS